MKDRSEIMPTSYTAKIENGDITTGKDFLTLCCNAFGVCIDMMENDLSEPIPEVFKPNDYYEDELLIKKKNLERAKEMTIEEVKRLIKKEQEYNVENLTRTIEKERSLRDEYLRIREEVAAWVPPTEEHVNLKKFALEQIDMSIPSQETINYYINELNKEIPTPEEYIRDLIKHCEESLRYYQERYDEEVKLAQERNKWITELRKSLLEDKNTRLNL